MRQSTDDFDHLAAPLRAIADVTDGRMVVRSDALDLATDTRLGPLYLAPGAPRATKKRPVC